VIPRRTFARALALLSAAGPLAARAQPGAKVARIGVLLMAAPDSAEMRPTFDAFRRALHERGYAQGRNLEIDFRVADGRVERLPALARELVALDPDVIVTGPTPAARAAREATATIPIVAVAMQDPVGDRLVASLARPGGNLTGLTFLGPELAPKCLSLLKEAVPGATRIAVLWHPGSIGEETAKALFERTEDAVRTLGVQLQPVALRDSGDLERGYAAMTRERANALLLFPSPVLFTARRRVAALAAAHRLPSIGNAREYADLGCLLSYGASIAELYRRGAGYVDRILKGAKPGELPIEQPTQFELVINLKTAKALGLTIPQPLLLRADEVIE
jgi:ABC-type uncharacterized transport system substrate-binding protein